MAEYISRDDAEKALLERCKETGYGGLTPDDIRLVMRTPWRIPAADVIERKIGKWIEIERNDVNSLTGKCGVYVGCSECGAPLPTDNQLDFIDESDCKFCYNCGARMEG